MNSKSPGAGKARKWLAMLALAGGTLALSGCVSRTVDEAKLVDVPVSVGMSRADLRSYFGEPLRIEKDSDGSERWIYRVYSPEEKRREVSETKSETATSLEISKVVTSWTLGGRREGTVYVSAEGVVVAPTPDGQILRR